MRKSLLLAALVVAACSKEETPAADSAATATPPPATPAPLSAADLTGTWHGIVKAEGTDSVVNRFTAVRTTDSTGKTISEGAKDSVAYTIRYDADSMIATSAPYTDPSLPKGTPPVMYRSVGRLKDGKLVGTSSVMFAAKPDSVISRSTWEATRTP
jgi:hypothetical protein